MGEYATQKFAILGALDPQHGDAGTYNTDIVNAGLYDSVVFLWQTGAVSSCSGKIVFTIYEGTKSTVASTSVDKITWLQSSTGDQNLQYILEVPVSVLNRPTNYFLKGRAVYSGGTGWNVSCAVLGFGARFHPASDNDAASVDSITICT